MYSVMENFKPVRGYEDYYLISDLGRLYSRRYKRFKKSFLGSDGYYYYQLSADGLNRRTTLHRLVATAFIPNPENLEQVNHKDGVKTNNKLDNLEWVSRSGNSLHAYKLGLKLPNLAEKNGRFDHQIHTFFHPDYGTIKCTQHELRNKYQIRSNNLTEMIQGKRKTAKGWSKI